MINFNFEKANNGYRIDETVMEMCRSHPGCVNCPLYQKDKYIEESFSVICHTGKEKKQREKSGD